MGAARVPPEVLDAFGLGERADVRAGPHPWAVANTLLARVEGRSLALRRWVGASALPRMRREAAHLAALGETGFADFAPRVAAVDGAAEVFEGPDAAWTAYALLPGASPRRIDRAAARLAGELLARFHRAAVRAAVPSAPSRLRALPGVHARLTSTPGLSADRWRVLEDEVVGTVDALESGPRLLVHGDYVLENILAADRARLVDFEFSRHDVRGFDFAALAAPLRRHDGSFELAPPEFLDEVVATYGRAAGDALALTRTELDVLPRLAAAHWMFVVDDLGGANSAYLGAAVEVLCALTDRVRSHEQRERAE